MLIISGINTAGQRNILMTRHDYDSATEFKYCISTLNLASIKTFSRSILQKKKESEWKAVVSSSSPKTLVLWHSSDI